MKKRSISPPVIAAGLQGKGNSSPFGWRFKRESHLSPSTVVERLVLWVEGKVARFSCFVRKEISYYSVAKGTL